MIVFDPQELARKRSGIFAWLLPTLVCLGVLVFLCVIALEITETSIKRRLTDTVALVTQTAVSIKNLDLRPGLRYWSVDMPRLYMWASESSGLITLKDLSISIPTKALPKGGWPSHIKAVVSESTHNLAVLPKTDMPNAESVIEKWDQIWKSLVKIGSMRELDLRIEDQTFLFSQSELHCSEIRIKKESPGQLSASASCDQFGLFEITTQFNGSNIAVLMQVRDLVLGSDKDLNDLKAESFNLNLDLNRKEVLIQADMSNARLCRSCKDIQNLNFSISLDLKDPEILNLQLRDFDMKHQDEEVTISSVTAAWSNPFLSLTVPVLDLVLFKKIALTMPISALKSFREALEVKGSLLELGMRIPFISHVEKKDRGSLSWEQAAFSSGFENLGFISPFYQITSASATGRVTGEKGVMIASWNSEQTLQKIPHLYSEPQFFDRFDATIMIKSQEEDKIQLIIKHAHYRNDIHGLYGTADAQFNWVRKKSSFAVNQHKLEEIVMNFDVPAMHASALKLYLPDADGAGAETIQWLDESIHGGMLNNNSLSLRYLPLERAEKRMHTLNARLQVNGVLVRANGIWPEMKVETALARLDKDKIQINDAKVIYRNSIIQATLRIIELEENPHLYVSAQGSSDISDVLEFVKTAPVFEDYHQDLQNYGASGQSDYSIHFHFPLQTDEEVRLDGQISCHRCLVHLPWDLSIENINGSVVFNEAFFSSPEKITASVMGGAYEASLRSVNNQDGFFRELIFSGSATSELVKFLLPELVGLTIEPGSAQVAGTLALKDRETYLEMKSDLKGLSWDMPPPLTKTKDQKLEMSASLSIPDDTDELHLRVNLGEDILTDMYMYEDSNFQIQLKKGVISFRKGSEIKMPEDGLSIAASVEDLDLGLWADWYAQTESCGENTPDYGINARVDFEKSNYRGLPVGAGQMISQTVGEKQKTRFYSAVSEGEIAFSCGKKGGRFAASLDWFDLKVLVDSMETQEQSDPDSTKQPEKQYSEFKVTDIHPGSAHIASLRYGADEIGELNLRLATRKSHRGYNSLIVDQMLLRGDFLDLDFEGSWRVDDEIEHSSRVDVVAHFKRYSDIFSKLPLLAQIPSQSGTINAQLNWQGSPFNPILSTLAGKLNASLYDGSIVGIEKGTASYLISILNLVEILRLIKETPSQKLGDQEFNHLIANLDFQDGMLDINELLLETNTINLESRGMVDLVSEQLDLEIDVTPELDNVVYSLLFWLNPQALLSAFILDPLWDRWGNAIVFEYDVSGDFDNPVFARSEAR